MAWQFSNDKPIFQQLIDRISTDIVSGKYKPGEKLESVRELALTVGVNPNTMQRALSELEGTGLIYTKRASGRYISENPQLTQTVLEKLVREKSLEFIGAMRDLGLSGQQITETIQKLISEAGTDGSDI